MSTNLLPIILIETKEGIPLDQVITKFSYKFSEKDDDICEFTIESDNPFIADSPLLQEGKQLSVQWGYSDGRMSKRRKVWIFDIDPDYSETGITMKFICHEKFVTAKMDVASTKSLENLKADTPIMFSSKVLANVSLELQKGNKELKALLNLNNINTDKQKLNANDGDKVVTYYNGNYSSFKSLKDFFNKFPGGPYVIDSRDDGVIIRTRDFKQKSIVTYSYSNEEGNPLIKFKPETKNRTNASTSEGVKVTSWDPAKKEALTQKSSIEDKGQVKLASGRSLSVIDLKGMDETIPIDNKNFQNTGLTQAQKNKAVSKFGGIPVKTESVLKTLKNKDGNAVKNTDGKLPASGPSAIKKWTRTSYGTTLANKGRFNPSKPISVAVDNTAVAKVLPYVENSSSEDDSSGKSMISPEDHKKSAAWADNIRKDSELDTNPATAEVEGNPFLECGVIITVLGVAKKHSGNYYVRDCEHVIDDNGYITNCTKMGRDGVNKTKTTVNKDSSSLPQEQYLYDLTNEEGFDWDNGNVINTSKGDTTIVSSPKNVIIPVTKA